MTQEHKLIHIEDYEQFTGAEMVARVQKKARLLDDLRVAHVNSTKEGGGVAEILSSLTLLMNSAGINTEWRVMEGTPEFFNVTKKMHNALQGADETLSFKEQQIYEELVYENAIRNKLDHDRVIVHDPQPLPLINHYERKGPWIWQCHVDLTAPNLDVWNYLKPFIVKYNTVIFSLKEYAKDIGIPQTFIKPAIDPFVLKNIKMSEEEIQQILDEAKIPTDLPLVVQISRFDKWKDPAGVIEAFKQARAHVDATLVLLGSSATDDPEGDGIYQSLLEKQEERIIILSHEDSALVNALQSRAAVVLQKSLREGFGLTVSEAMWKGTPVIGGNVGGIPKQIEDGENGFLVSSIEEAADRIVLLLQHPALREEMGRKAHETVKEHFLMIRLLEQYLDLLATYEPALAAVRS
ncbi:MAG: glycosyltransferase [Caldilineaceae bacterium]|nr:glycosyltransferase [Caldilineaceae bacterium]